ncbi:MAG: cell division protein FtsL [Gammaproteobacteria bacterium]|nr:cell division protein FtsL [Gammaproteobacteria bacterium]
MNAIAREAFAENNFSSGMLFSFDLAELRILILVCLLLVSALGVVYVKDLNRRLFISCHKLQVQTEQLKADGNRLLLEQSAWGAQARVQMVAQQQLQMKIPASAEVMMIKV